LTFARRGSEIGPKKKIMNSTDNQVKKASTPERGAALIPPSDGGDQVHLIGSENKPVSWSSTVGAQVWFDMPVMLTIFMLGAYMLAHDPSGLNLYLTLLILGTYAALSLLFSTITPWRAGALPTFLRRANTPYSPLNKFIIDTAFAITVTLLDGRSDPTLAAIVLVLAGTRMLAYVSGGATPLVLVPGILPVAFLLLNSPALTGGIPLVSPNEELIAQVIVITCCLIIAHTIFGGINPHLAENVNLTTALAESDLSLRESQARMEENATRLAEQVLRLDLLQDSLRAMNSAVDLDTLLRMIVDNAVSVLKAEHSSIGLIDAKTGELVIRAATGVDASHLHRRRFLPGVGVAGWVVQHGQPLVVGDVQKDSQYLNLYAQGDTARRTRSMLCVPLTVEQKVIGALCVTHSLPDALTKNDQVLLTSFADQAALAVHKSQLYSTVSLKEQQTAALYRLMLGVNEANSRKRLAEAICSQLMTITGARGAALLMEDAERSRIVVWAQSGEWEGCDTREIALPTHGDPFMSSTLAALHRTSGDHLSLTQELFIVEGAPYEVAKTFASVNCVTIPLSQNRQIYGLLVIEPGTEPPIPDEISEMVRLAISHCSVALERAELYDQSLSLARQSSMLYSIAAEVQTSLDPASVIAMTISSAMEALPIQSCEVYLKDDLPARSRERTEETHAEHAGDEIKVLHKRNMESILSHEYEWLLGPESLSSAIDPMLLEVLNSPWLIEEEIDRMHRSDSATNASARNHRSMPVSQSSRKSDEITVLRGRLMGSKEAIGFIRLTTTLSVMDFIHKHATFCQTLLTHAGGAIERSRLYTTVARQAQTLEQRAHQLTDIAQLGTLSMAGASARFAQGQSLADVPLAATMEQLGLGITRSLDLEYIRIGEVGPGSTNVEVWASTQEKWGGISGISSGSMPLESLEKLIAAGERLSGEVHGVSISEEVLAATVPGLPALQPRVEPRRLVLMLLEGTDSGVVGYIIAALQDEAHLDEIFGLLSIIGQRTALVIENHRIYSQLLESKRKMEAVVLSISDGVIVTDGDLNVLITNSVADVLIGFDTLSHKKPLHELVPNDELLSLVKESVASSKRGIMDVDFEIDNEVHTYEAVVQTIGGYSTPAIGSSESAHDMPIGVVITLRDVTVARATERAKSDFLSMTSHELRTPLNSVLGFLDIVLTGKTGDISDLQADFLGTAKQEAVVLQRLIADLLDYSQLNSGMLRMEMAPTDLSAVIRRVVAHAIPRGDEERLRITNEVARGLIVTGDDVRLEQVFKNLFDNAAKCTQEGGEIKFGSKVRGKKITIWVQDTGSGIAGAEVEKVFDRFYQGTNETKGRKRGLGLGLPICKNIIEGHGGRIWLESKVGLGTTVFVELERFDPAKGWGNLDLDLEVWSAKSRPKAAPEANLAEPTPV
jgi:signal transduction histidine kinase/putative methionine-R-sulfoxide reductase with GAF domain